VIRPGHTNGKVAAPGMLQSSRYISLARISLSNQFYLPIYFITVKLRKLLLNSILQIQAAL
jgi:hypothetical protein